MDPEWKKPAALIGIAGVILSAIAVLVAVLQGGGDATPEEHLANCRRAHDAPTTQHRSVFSVGRWADCSWPPAAGAAKDGYGEVRLTRADNGASSNVDYLGADIFTTKCHTITLQYRHDQQGLSVISNKLSVDVGQVLELRGTGNEDSPMKLARGVLPAFANLHLEEVSIDRLVVLVPIAFNVTRVECS